MRNVKNYRILDSIIYLDHAIILRTAIGQMLQQSAQREKDVERSLDRLQLYLDNNNLNEIIPALYYSADLLQKYSAESSPSKLNFSYFRNFKLELENFATKDLNFMKQHQKQILDEMLDIVNSDAFTQNLQPEIKTSRLKSSTNLNNHNLNVQHSQSGFYTERSQKMNKNQKILSSLNPKNEAACKMFEELLTAYRQHRIDEAHELKMEYQLNKYPLNDDQKSLFSTIELQYNTMISFYQQFDLQGWIFDKEENGVTLEYKIFEEEKQIAIRIGSEFDVPVQNFLSILSEIDLMGTYIPFTYDSKQLKVISRNQKIGTSKIYIPCLTDRQTYFYAAGYDRMKKNRSIFLFSKTINEDLVYQEKYQFKVPQKSDYIRLEYKFFIVEYIPISKTRAKVRLASKVDMKLNFLPQFILNMSARKFAFDYFKNIIKVNKNFKGSAWQAKIKENPEFYEFFKSRVSAYMGTI